MTVYFDLVLLSNFIVNYLFLYLINMLFKDDISHLRLVICSALASFLLFFFLIDYFIYYIFKICGGIIICFFMDKGVKYLKKVVKVITFYIINFTFIGVLSSFNVSKTIFLYICLLAVICLFIIENNKKYYIFYKYNTYNVTISFDNSLIKVNGFFDTGNFSTFKNLPIIYVDKKYMPNIQLRYNYAIINTVTGPSNIKIYQPNAIAVENKRVNAYVCFTNLCDVDCLLNGNIFI